MLAITEQNRHIVGPLKSPRAVVKRREFEKDLTKSCSSNVEANLTELLPEQADDNKPRKGSSDEKVDAKGEEEEEEERRAIRAKDCI